MATDVRYILLILILLWCCHFVFSGTVSRSSVQTSTVTSETTSERRKPATTLETAFSGSTDAHETEESGNSVKYNTTDSTSDEEEELGKHWWTFWRVVKVSTGGGGAISGVALILYFSRRGCCRNCYCTYTIT